MSLFVNYYFIFNSNLLTLDNAINPDVVKKYFDCFSRQVNIVKFSGSSSFSKSSSVSPKKFCKFSCRWCSFLFWSGPAALLLHKLRHHARLDKQRLVLYKELLLERLAWKPPRPAIEYCFETFQKSF